MGNAQPKRYGRRPSRSCAQAFDPAGRDPVVVVHVGTNDIALLWGQGGNGHPKQAANQRMCAPSEMAPNHCEVTEIKLMQLDELKKEKPYESDKVFPIRKCKSLPPPLNFSDGKSSHGFYSRTQRICKCEPSPLHVSAFNVVLTPGLCTSYRLTFFQESTGWETKSLLVT